MIQCDQAALLLEAYLDKELHAEDIKHLEEHLQACKDCVGHMEFDQALKQLVQKKAFQEKISPGLRSEIQKKLRQ